MKCFIALFLCSAATAFTVTPLLSSRRAVTTTTALAMSDGSDEEPPSLILGGDEMEQHLKEVQGQMGQASRYGVLTQAANVCLGAITELAS